jgi:hypothetical protein
MINKSALLAVFVFCGFVAVLGWDNVMQELPGYIAVRSISDCTFACQSHLMRDFGVVVAFTTLFSSVAAGSLFGCFGSLVEDEWMFFVPKASSDA